LEVVGLVASGIVACVAMSVGGKPWSAVGDSEVKTNMQVSTSPTHPKGYFRSGDQLEAAAVLFGPSADEDITSGAQEIVHVKVNPATQSTASFDNSDGEAMVTTSTDYGWFTTQINISIATGTNQGKLVVITFEDTVETLDDLGGDIMFTLVYLSGTPADGFTTITAEVTASAIQCAFTRTQTGLDGDVTNQATPSEVIEVVSSDAGDIGMVIEIYGTNTSDAQQTAQVVLDGTTAVDTTETWNSFHGARILSGTVAGTVTLRRDGAGLTIATLTAGAPTTGLEPCVDMPVGVSSVIKIVLDGLTDFVAGDVGKIIQADGDNIGPLIDYSNDDPIADEGIAWVRDTNNHGTVVDNQAITTVGGTGAGSAKGASSAAAWLDYVASGASTARITVVGLAAGGAQVAETVQLDGTNPIVGSVAFASLTYLALGEQAAGVTLTVGGNAVRSLHTGINTLQKAADLFNSTPGFTFTLVTGETAFDPAKLDVTAAASILSPADLDVYADLEALIVGINNESALVTAARGSVATGVPDNTTDVVYLAGGHEGSATPGQEATPTATSSDWQGALDLLRKVRVNSIVVMTHDPAIHAMLKTHIQYMDGRSERDGGVGLQNAAQTGLASKSEIKSQIVNLNTRHIRAWAQNIDRYGAVSADVETMEPKFGAAMLIGMQAGSPVGTPLTFKLANALAVEQDSSWNPADDAEEMVRAGLVFAETIDGVGRRIIRNVTTHLQTSNIAYVDAHVNEAVNFSVYDLRTEMQGIVGDAGFNGTVSSAYGTAHAKLMKMIGISLVAFRSLEVTLALDVFTLGVEMSPVIGINFVKNNVHLTSIPQTAAAA
jgi:hypothetical protein